MCTFSCNPTNLVASSSAPDSSLWTHLDRVTRMSHLSATLQKTPTCQYMWRSGLKLSSIYAHSLLVTKCSRRNMATVKDSIPHTVRTAADQRQRALYTATIGRIEQVNSTIRLLRLYLDNDQVRPSQKTWLIAKDNIGRP